MPFAGDAGRMPVAPDHESLLRLLQSGAPASALRRLLDTHGGAAAAIAAGRRDWASHGFDAATCAALLRPDVSALERSLHWLDAPAHHLLGWRDPAYPPLLRRIASPPAMLFVAGDADLLWRPAVAIVGSRAATAGGPAHPGEFAAPLARGGPVGPSGRGAGRAAAAHQATLDAGGMTVAVLGTGPDVAYPARHRPLMARIAEAGAVVSEHPPGTQPLRTHFPSRNRILVGLSLGIVVVEAASRSGALITARLAGDAGREVFALPGSIHNPMVRGCHRLIREGAALVETPGEVVEALAPLVRDLVRSLRGELAPCPPPAAGQDGIGLPDLPDINRLWQALGHDPTGMDELLERSGLTAAAVSSMLLALELEGRVAAEHGRYSRIGV